MKLRNHKSGVWTLACCLIAAHTTNANAAGAWAVARSPQAFPGACYVGKPPFPRPVSDQYSQILASGLESRKAACQKANDLKTDDPTDSTRCFTYSTASVTDCKSEGVDLSK